MEFPDEGVAMAESVENDCVQLRLFELAAETDAMVVLELTVTAAVEVQPFDWVTVAVYVPAEAVEKEAVVLPPGLQE